MSSTWMLSSPDVPSVAAPAQRKNRAALRTREPSILLCRSQSGPTGHNGGKGCRAKGSGIRDQESVTISVEQAKNAAARWESEVAAAWPGFEGAFLHGSITWLADDATLPATSDVDVIVVLAGGDRPPNPGKFLFDGVLLDASILRA